MRPEEWIVSNDTGVSSKTIWSVMMGVDKADCFGPGTPSDPSDFGRCYRLLKAIPGWRARLPEVAVKYPHWKGLIDNWEELEKLYEEEHPSGRAPKLYARMNEIEREQNKRNGVREYGSRF